MKEEQIFKVINILLDTKAFITAEQLSNQTELSKKTILKIIKDIPDYLKPFGMTLIIKKGSGYKIIITNEQKKRSFEHYRIRILNKNDKSIPCSHNSRVTYIVKKFLTSENYIKIEDLIDELFISKSTLKSVMKDVKNIFNTYDININSIPHYGSILVGHEFKIRLCFCNFSHLPQTIETLSNMCISKDDILEYISWVKELFIHYHFDLTDDCFYNIINYIFISIIRNHYHHFLLSLEIESYNNDILDVSKSCMQYFQKHSIYFTDDEICQLALLIYSLKNDKLLNTYHNNTSVTKLVEIIIDKLNTKYLLNINNQSYLYKGLIQHLIPLEMRIMLGYSLENPLKNEINNENKFAKEIADYTAKIIEDYYNCILSDDEVSYLTLHFSLALLKLKEKEFPKIILISPVSKGIQQMLKYKLSKALQLEDFQIKISSFYSLKSLDLKEYKCIVSTHNIPYEINLPTIKVDYTLTETQISDIKKIIS